MEPHATVAHVDGDHITLWAGTQEPFTLREHLVRDLSSTDEQDKNYRSLSRRRLRWQARRQDGTSGGGIGLEGQAAGSTCPLD